MSQSTIVVMVFLVIAVYSYFYCYSYSNCHYCRHHYTVPGKPVGYKSRLFSVTLGYSGLSFWTTWLSRLYLNSRMSSPTQRSRSEVVPRMRGVFRAGEAARL